MPVTLMGSTIQLATHFLSGGATTTAGVSASVLELAKGVQALAFISKLKFISMGLVAIVALTAIGAVALVQRVPVDRRSGNLQPRRSGAPDLLTRSRIASDTRPWLKTLPNGGTIELIGISPHPSGSNTWWNPDGSPLEQPPCDPSNSRLKATEDTIPIAVVVRLSNLPPDADPQLIRSRWWRNRSDIDADETAVQDGKTVPGLRIVVASFSKNQTTGTIWFEAATGPWQTVATFQEFTTKGDTSGGLSFMSGRAIAMNNGGTALTVTHNIQETRDPGCGGRSPGQRVPVPWRQGRCRGERVRALHCRIRPAPGKHPGISDFKNANTNHFVSNSLSVPPRLSSRSQNRKTARA